MLLTDRGLKEIADISNDNFELFHSMECVPLEYVAQVQLTIWQHSSTQTDYDPVL